MPVASQVFPLYEEKIPGAIDLPNDEKAGAGGNLQRVTRPTITMYPPVQGKANGSSIVIFPGGGYIFESYKMEGTDVAEMFQRWGVTGFLVKYRLPSDLSMRNKAEGPLQDAQQAMRFVRIHAAQWNLNPDKVGIIGLSAGGHLASTLGTHFDKALVGKDVQTNLRPSFMILVYPVITMHEELTHAITR